MSIEILCSKPQRPHKQALADIDSDALSVSKHTQWSLSSLSTSLTHSQCFESSHSFCHSSSQSLKDLNTHSASLKKHHQLQLSCFKLINNQHLQVTCSNSALLWCTCVSEKKHCCSQLLTDLSVDAWISTVFSSDFHSISSLSDYLLTCSAIIDVSKDKHTSSLLATIKQMLQQSSQHEENVDSHLSTSQSDKFDTLHLLYWGILYNNYITLNYLKRQMLEELKTFANTQILKQWESSQLKDEAVFKVIDTVKKLTDSTEDSTAKLIKTNIFSFKHHDIAKEKNTSWSTVVLSNNSAYQYDVFALKPDTHFKYFINQRSGWSYAQFNVITHSVTHLYAQSMRDNTFSFLMIEIKSEAAEETIYVAENQAADSHSHSVNALLWLL